MLNNEQMHDAFKPQLTIVTTVFNDRDVIGKLLKSLINQIDTNFIHIIYEDGSKIDSIDIVDEYIKKVKLLKKPFEIYYFKGEKNYGVNKAHEIAFKKVRTNYFTWIDSDDWVDKKFVKTINRFIKKYPHTTVFHLNSWEYDEDYKKHKRSSIARLSRCVRKSHDQFPAYCLNSERYWNNFVIKTNDLKKINKDITIFSLNNGKNVLWYDAQILFELCFSHCDFVTIKKPLSNILERKTSVSRKGDIKINSVDTYNLIVETLPFDQHDIEFYKEMLDYSKSRMDIYNLLVDNKYQEAKLLMLETKKYIKNKKLGKNYLLYGKSINYLYIRCKFKLC